MSNSMYKIKITCLLLSSFTLSSTFAQNSGASAQKIDSLNTNKSFFQLSQDQYRNDDGHLRYSIITGFRDGLPSSLKLGNFDSYIDKTNGTTRIVMINLSIFEMLTMGFVRPNKVVLEVKDPSSIIYDSSQGEKSQWMKKNAHCFEYLMPYGMVKESEPIRREIAHYFGLNFSKQMRTVDVLVVKKSSIRLTENPKNHGINTIKGGEIRQQSLDYLLDFLTSYNFPPMINETNESVKLDFDITNDDVKTLSSLKDAFRRYGFEIQTEKRKMEMFVIAERG
jgi:hypothetical protein